MNKVIFFNDDSPKSVLVEVESRAVHNENWARKVEGSGTRTKYGGKSIDPEKLKNPPNNNL